MHPNPAYIEALREMIETSAYPSLLSMKMVEMGVGFSRFEIEISADKHLQPYGIVHGGVYATLIDTATYWALFFGYDDPRSSLLSVDLKVNYLAPMSRGKMRCVGKQIKLGRTLGLAEARIEDEEGKLLAYGSSTLILKQGLSLGDPAEMPSKFLEAM